MNYSIAQENLRKAFRELAVAKQDFLFMGGELQFEVRRNNLYMTMDGATASFPIVVDSDTLEKFKNDNPQHEYKE